MGNSTPLDKIHDSPAQESQEIHWDDRGDRTESHLCCINSNINWITFFKSLWKWKSTNNNKGGERYEALTVHFFPLSLTGESEQHMRHISAVMKGIQIGNSGLSSSLSSLRHSPYRVKQKRPGPSVHHSPSFLKLSSSPPLSLQTQAACPIWISLFPNKAPQGLSGSD